MPPIDGTMSAQSVLYSPMPRTMRYTGIMPPLKNIGMR